MLVVPEATGVTGGGAALAGVAQLAASAIAMPARFRRGEANTENESNFMFIIFNRGETLPLRLPTIRLEHGPRAVHDRVCRRPTTFALLGPLPSSPCRAAKSLPVFSK